MTTHLAIFIGIAVIAIATAVSVLASRNAVYSALFLVLNFITIASLYLLLNAAFIALVQVTVYAGAIMVLFLFVIMLLGEEREESSSRLKWQAPAAFLMSLALLILFVAALIQGNMGLQQAFAGVSEGFGSPASVGRLLFSEYLIPFEVTSVLLLVAMVGAIVLTRPGREDA
jgi:NADH-quinone oxidoreductase subunit J